MAEVGIVGLVLALPPVLDRLIAVGKNVALRLEALQNPRSKLGDLSNFKEQDARLFIQFKIGQQIYNDPNVEKDIKDSLAKDFDDIQKSMLEAVESVERVEKSSKMHRFWVIDKPRKALEESIRRLQTSVEHFQDTTLLIYMSSSLHSQVLIQSDDFQTTAATSPVPMAEGVLMCRGHLARALLRTQPKRGWFVHERRSYTVPTKTLVDKDMRFLSELLSTGPACRNILDIVGYRDVPNIQQFELVFDVQEHLDFVGSLRQFIQTNDSISLNYRIDLSRQLANAVLLVHRLNLVHKNVNSANIMLFRDTQATSPDEAPRELILVNWHLVRKASGATQLLGQPKWWRGIYQHPTRQMALAEKEYTMAHDIYSLGVCLLELLLWSNLVIENPGAPPSPSDLFKTEVLHLQLLSQEQWDGASLHAMEESFILNPRDIQKVLVSLATRKLPSAAGDRLTRLVLSCLTALESGFGEEDIVATSRVDTGLNFVTAVKDALMQVCI